MERIPLGMQDAQMIMGDSYNVPMHVGGFNVYVLPSGAPEDFLRQLVAELRSQPIESPPWNYRLAAQGAVRSKLTPAWEIAANQDTHYHVAHHALPAPGGERELGELLSRLHSQPLDMTRPLWEWHIVEGYRGGRFVIYQKIHHALFDGTTGMRAFSAMNSEAPDAPVLAPWRASELRTPTEEPPAERTLGQRLSGFQKSVRKGFDLYLAVPPLLRAASKTLSAAMGDESGLVAPYSGPKCIVNNSVTRRRRIATAALNLARVKAVSKASECTLNDVVLAVCGGALRRYLQELDELPAKSLTAGVPIGIKHEEGSKSGNKVSLMFATLATSVRDPLKRLLEIRRSTTAGKEHLMQLTPGGRDAYGTLMLLPAIAGSAMGAGGRVMTNVPISNVPGPRVPLYLGGAALEAAYPTSVLLANNALGITFVSYNTGLYMGLISCPDVLPHVQKLALYITDSFDELERAVMRKRAAPSPGAEGRPASVRAQGSARKGKKKPGRAGAAGIPIRAALPKRGTIKRKARAARRTAN
jgi:diacylglycerol O-acyltransferase / wax synthase